MKSPCTYDSLAVNRSNTAGSMTSPVPCDRLAGALDELVLRPVVDGDAHDRAVQQAAGLQAVQRPERHHLRQVAGDPEDHQDVRRALLGAPLRAAIVILLSCARPCGTGACRAVVRASRTTVSCEATPASSVSSPGADDPPFGLLAGILRIG